MQKFKFTDQKINSSKVLLSVLYALVIILALSHTLDNNSQQQIDNAFNRALMTFAIAKTLNGVISVAQGTELAIQPAGIGINLTPGQILDPVNDLIERFSWVMLASTTSLGIQKIFLNISTWPVFNYFFIFIIFLSVIFLFITTTQPFALRLFLIRSSLILIMLRFMVPVASISSELIYQIFLQNEYATSSTALKATTQKIDKISQHDISKQAANEKNQYGKMQKHFIMQHQKY